MGLFRRRRESELLDDVLLNLAALGEEMIDVLAETHVSWGLGSADRWDLDQRTGIISWTFPDKVATAPAQLLGSYNPSAGSWMWAWANASILPDMSRDSHLVRAWALANNHAWLAEPKVEADDAMAANLSAIAVSITQAKGFYRGSQYTSWPIITFGTVTLTAEDGTTSTFDLD
jgi:hypothetical protein